MPEDTPENGQGIEDTAGTGYGGHATLEELIAENQGNKENATNLTRQVQNLESLKGRQGSEIGQLREENTKLSLTQKPEQSSQELLKNVTQQLNNGEITEDEANQLIYNLSFTDAKIQMGQQFDEKLDSMKADLEHKDYVKNFIKDNPGYSEAFDSGALEPWLSQGLPGEQAWDKFNIQTLMQNNEKLKQDYQSITDDAEKKGMQKGIKLEQGKESAGKVLGGEGGRYTEPNAVQTVSKADRQKGGLETLAKMRKGG